MIAVYILLALIAAFLAVVLVRAAAFKPKADVTAPPVSADAVDAQKAIDDLAAMVRVRTVSGYDDDKVDWGEFARFRALLRERFPHVFAACTYEELGKSGVLLKLPGESADKPAVFMAHYDVVPVNDDQWDKPAFDGIIEDGVLWGRGTLDTKGTLCGVMEAAETLLRDGFTPKNDMYFAFSGDEEIAGSTQPTIVQAFKARGVVPAIVVDEGGAVVDNVFPGVAQSCALIGLAEKGMMDVQFTLEGAGGHASAPPPHTGVGRLAKAVTEVENKPFSRKLTKPVAEMFDTLGRRSTVLYRVIFANLWCFLPVLDGICKKSGGELNAMMRTTAAFTQMEGSKASNVLPPKASVVANFRIITGETMESVLTDLRARISDKAITMQALRGMDPCKSSETKGYGWEHLTAAVKQTWPEALVSPYLMVACSDSRHYCAISDNVYRFSAMYLTKEERGLIHGNNERIPTEKIVRTAQFYYRLLKSL